MVYTLYKETKTTGCMFEDGADTTETTEKFVFIPEEKQEEYGEYLADEYGNQDYSYRFCSKKIAVFQEYEIMDLINSVKSLAERLYKEQEKETDINEYEQIILSERQEYEQQ